MTCMKSFTGAAIALALSATASLADMPVIKAAVLKFGTVNWELDTIRHFGLDEANGFRLEVEGVAGNPATQVAFQSGAADIIVSDWLWVARQRASGHDFVFIPYSKAVGGLMVTADSPARTLADLAGEKIGIAGGPVDKSWLILRAFAEQEYGIDLKAETEQVFGAPPLMFKTALQGETAGAINFWHYMAKMEAAGMRTLLDVSTAAEALGLDPETPLLGYVLHGEFVREHPDLAAGLAAASRGAKDILASDPAAWDRLRDRMNADTDAEFEALKAGFLAGTPAPGPVDEEAAARMLALMARLGGEELLGDVQALPEGLFLQPPS